MKKIDCKGFTLVEMIISIAISAIVIGSLAYFLHQSSRNYRSTSQEISLQLEAQLIINQLDDLIMEAYNVKFDAGTGKLTIYQEETIAPGDAINPEKMDYIISLDSSNHQLMYEKIRRSDLSSTGEKLCGKYVESFQVVDTGTNNRNKNIEITLELRNDGKTFSVKKNIISIRNRIRNVV